MNMFKKLSILVVFTMCFLLPFPVYAYASQCAVSLCSISVLYAVTALLSLILLISYCAFVKKKELWLLLLFVSVFLVNAGYFSLSISQNLSEALLANRLSYLGSVFLPMFMMMSIANICAVKIKKHTICILILINAAVFIIAASPGFTTWYYKEAALVIVNGASKLQKVYGPFHRIYPVFLISYLIAMIGIIVSYAKKHEDKKSAKQALVLLFVVLLNIVFWSVEQLIKFDFEFLSITYILSELLLLLMYSMFSDFGPSPAPAKESDNADKEIMESICTEVNLSAREKDVFDAIIKGKKRKEIADELFISENTVKTHTSNIFSKFGVTSRNELFEKINNTKK